MCYQLILAAALPKALGGGEAAVMYIDTERKFSSQRLLEMAQARYEEAVICNNKNYVHTPLIEFPPVLPKLLACNGACQIVCL
jgi:hypothetical protein